MKLEDVRGVGKPLADKLRKAGVHNAEELATVDTRKVRLPGVPEEKLRALRRDAQRTLFEAAVQRVEKIADQALVTVEEFIREASQSAVAAAQEAQERASLAIEAARRQTHALARVAATRTHQAARVAEREYRKLNRKIQSAEPALRDQLVLYQKGAQRATAAAKRASIAAKGALAVARTRSASSKRSGKKPRSLAARVRKEQAKNGARRKA